MRSVLIICVMLFWQASSAQVRQDGLEESPGKDLQENERFGESVRGANAITLGLGSAVMNGDLTDPLFEISFHAGYKRFINPYLNINFTYHKFNLAYKDQFNEGFMSFDLNLEFSAFPYRSFSPFIYAGGGYHAANYFESTLTKIQGGAGIEYLVLPKLGLKLYADYNHVFDDELDGRVFGDSDDIYWRMGLGVNLYFGQFSKKSHNRKGDPTVIDSNPIIESNE